MDGFYNVVLQDLETGERELLYCSSEEYYTLCRNIDTTKFLIVLSEYSKCFVGTDISLFTKKFTGETGEREV